MSFLLEKKYVKNGRILRGYKIKNPMQNTLHGILYCGGTTPKTAPYKPHSEKAPTDKSY